MKNFRLFSTPKSLQRTIQNSRKFSKRVERHCGKRRNCLLCTISSFPFLAKGLTLNKIFSFSINVLCHFKNRNDHFCNMLCVIYKCHKFYKFQKFVGLVKRYVYILILILAVKPSLKIYIGDTRRRVISLKFIQ